MSRRGNREGSVYRRSDGRWVAAVAAGGGRGVQKRKHIYGRTREEAARKLTEALKAVQDNMPLPSDRLTVASFAKEWLKGIRPSLRARTYESYEGILRVHVVPALGHIRLGKLKPADLEWLYADLAAEGLSATSIRNYHARIRTMLAKALRLGIVARNVANLVDTPRLVQRELPMVTLQEARDFLRAARGHRLEALFVLAITTGARQGELLGLTWDKVNLDAGEIEIRTALQNVGGRLQLVELKTKRSRRRVALTDMAVEALRRHRRSQLEDALRLGPAWNNSLNSVFTTAIGTPLERTNVLKRQFGPLVKRAGLSTELRFHDLRHIAATIALNQGMPVPAVSEMLGHSDAATTLRVYAHAVPGAQRHVADALQAVLAS